MYSIRLNSTVVLLAAASLAPLALRAQKPAESAQQLVRDVMYNELHDRERDSHWEYRSECHSAEKNLVREQVETNEGPVFRVIERNGRPLSEEQQREEERRLAAYIHDPGKMARVRQQHEEDEERLAGMIAVIPQAYVFEYASPVENGTVRIGFRPNPSYVPSGFEAKIVHALTGTLTVNTRMKRMVAMHGVLEERVDFGFGLLGHVDKGGSFEIHRRQVSARHWKTDLVDMNVEGKLLMLRTIGKVEREARSDFKAVPADTTPAAAEAMLTQPGAGSAEARLSPAE